MKKYSFSTNCFRGMIIGLGLLTITPSEAATYVTPSGRVVVAPGGFYGGVAPVRYYGGGARYYGGREYRPGRVYGPRRGYGHRWY